MNEDELLNEQIKKSLEEAVALGLVEIAGIEPDGSWLYQATPLCKELLSKDKTWEQIIDSIERLSHPE